jgi:hypothetical protein
MSDAADNFDGLGAADRRLLSTMTPEARARVRKINKINGGYLVTRRHHEVHAFVDRVIENAAAASMGPANKLRVGMIVGASGSGKSTAIEQVFAMRPEFQPYESELGTTVYPLVHFDAPAPATAIALLMEGLDQVGLPYTTNASQGILQRDLKRQLKHRRVKFLTIDEMQHALRGSGRHAINITRDLLKNLSQIKGWPLHIIVAGLPSLTMLLTKDEQLQNRDLILELGPLSPDGNGDLVRTMIKEVVENHAELEPGAIYDDVFVRRLMHAASYQFGSTIQMVRTACEQAVYVGSERLDAEHFATAYRSRTACPTERNVFTALDFIRIDVSDPRGDIAAEEASKTRKRRGR